MATYWKIECDPSAIIGAALTDQAVVLPAAPAGLITDCGGTLKDNVAISDTPGGSPFKYGVEDNSIIHVNADIADASQYFWARAEANAEDKSGVPSSDTECYWPLGESSSPAVNWANAGTLDGVGVGSPTWGAAGQIGDAVAFNGSTQYLVHGNYQFPAAVTIGFWANWNLSTEQIGFPIATGASNAANTYGVFIYKVDATHVRIDLYFFANSSHWRDWTWLYTDAAVPDNTWYRILISQASALATPDLYLNGVLQGAPSLGSAGTPTRSTQALAIGRRGAYDLQNFSGTIDAAFICARVLSSDEATFDHACGTGSIFGAWQEVPERGKRCQTRS